MSRLLLEKNLQRKFLEEICNRNGFTWKKIADLCGVSKRTVQDWHKEKFKIKYETALMLHKKTSVAMPKTIAVLPEYWNTKDAAVKGALRRYEKYGNPGTSKGRRKGGLVSQEKFRLNPEYAKNIGAKIRKEIKCPSNSWLLAEFVGILLGDGGITKNQVVITFNRDTDKPYSIFIQDTIKKLFNMSSTISMRISDKGDDIVVSSRNLVEFLLRKGMRIGSKVRNNADIPGWISEKSVYRIACLRGLIDTDGSFYLYRHRVNKKMYIHFSMCFTNHSRALLSSTYRLLISLGFSPTKCYRRVYLHKNMDIVKYFDIINSHNPKHLEKYKKFSKIKK